MTEADKGEIIKKVAERLSFFFSNANLRMDKFMRREVMEKEENEGFVKIDVLLKFNTIKAITEDAKLIADAAKGVKNPQLKINEDGSAIARVDPFTQDMMDDHVKVSLRLSNIPVKDSDDGPEYAVSRDEISALFEEYGDVAMVRLLKTKVKGYENKVAVGRGFVEFHTVEDMDKAVKELCTANVEDESIKPNKVLTVNGTDLRVKTMEQWLNKKKAQRQERESNSPKKRKADMEESENTPAIELFNIEWKSGCVISVKGLPDDCDREAILAAAKAFIGEEVSIRADYSRGMKDGAIRFDQPNERIRSLANELNEGNVTINDKKVDSASVLEGEEEEKYYVNYIAFRNKMIQEKMQQKRKKHRGRA